MDGFIRVFRASQKIYGVSEAGYWYRHSWQPVCIAGLLESRSDDDTKKLLRLMDRATFYVDITDDEIRQLFEGPGTLKEKSARLYQQLKGRDKHV